MTGSDDDELPVHSAELQVSFWAKLQQAEPQLLRAALIRTVAGLNTDDVDKELKQYVGEENLHPLTEQGLRGEVFFPVPVVLRANPQLIGYYRLLYGVSQKEFYQKPFSAFKKMEEKRLLSPNANRKVESLCRSLIETGKQLLGAVQPVTLETLHNLQMLTIGPLFRGSQNVIIGQGATKEVFELIRMMVEGRISSSTATVITVANAAQRSVQIAFAPDPDITIIEMMPSGPISHTSIEIKGGGDVSNVHNRLGEAEKSHLNAKDSGFTKFWTILNAKVEPNVAKAESPTTQEFFNLGELRDPNHPSRRRFKELLDQTIGI
jgi:hypothetical protein